MELKIGWLYPSLMNIYGDYGNVLTLKKRSEWREVKIKVVEIDQETKQVPSVDLLFMGGGQDRQQVICSQDLLKNKKGFVADHVESEKPALFVCGAYQLMAKFYHPLAEDEMGNFNPQNFKASDASFKSKEGADLEGIGVFDAYTLHYGPRKPRCIGNVAVDLNPNLYSEIQTIYSSKSLTTIVGFENHGGRTYPMGKWGQKISPLGKVKKGFGNNGEDQTEGAIYKNSLATYLHGPILPKNPHLADWLIFKALKGKYGIEKLEPLDDLLEWQAHEAILKKIS